MQQERAISVITIESQVAGLKELVPRFVSLNLQAQAIVKKLSGEMRTTSDLSADEKTALHKQLLELLLSMNAIEIALDELNLGPVRQRPAHIEFGTQEELVFLGTYFEYLAQDALTLSIIIPPIEQKINSSNSSTRDTVLQQRLRVIVAAGEYFATVKAVSQLLVGVLST